MKADKIDVEKLYEIKSDRIETTKMMKVQGILADQFKHILVLFVELIDLRTNNVHTQGSMENKYQHLLNQITALANQVMAFDPLEYIKMGEVPEPETPPLQDQSLNNYFEKVLSNFSHGQKSNSTNRFGAFKRSQLKSQSSGRNFRNQAATKISSERQTFNTYGALQTNPTMNAKGTERQQFLANNSVLEVPNRKKLNKKFL